VKVLFPFDTFATAPRLAGGVLGRQSYAPMRAAIKAALAEPLTSEERAAFDRIGGHREPPAEQVSELVIIAGRGSGKTQSMAALVVYLATGRKWKCDPGQIPTVLLLAADREQAAVAFRFVTGLIDASPVLKKELACAPSRDRVVLRSGVEIQVATSDYRRVRGRSLVAAVCDEIAFWPITPDSASPDSETLIALRPGLARFPGSMLIVISTPYAQQGTLYEFDRTYFGENDRRVLVVKGRTLDFNPTFPAEVIEDALKKDPAAAAAEYLCQYRSDIESFIDAALVDSLTRPSPLHLPKRCTNADGAFITYVGGLDVSGGRADATAAAVAHRDRDQIIVDACRRWPSPHDPKVVAAEVVQFFAQYGLSSAFADYYGAELSRSVYSGMSLVTSEHPRSDVYLRLLPLMTTGRVELPPDPTLRIELIGLTRRTARSGKDSVDHRPGCHDDVANAVALAAVNAARYESVQFDPVFTPSDAFDGYADEATVRASLIGNPWRWM
jgi:hypothetical protein